MSECSMCHAGVRSRSPSGIYTLFMQKASPRPFLFPAGQSLVLLSPPRAALFPAPVASSAFCTHTTLVFQLRPLPAPAELCGALLLWPGALRGLHGVLPGPGLGQHALLHAGLPADGDLLGHDRQGQCRERLRGQQSLTKELLQQPRFQAMPASHMTLLPFVIMF